MSQFREMKGDIVLPRFKLEYEAEFKDALTALGMGVAFGAGANFQGMCSGPLSISKVRHKTFTDVNTFLQNLLYHIPHSQRHTFNLNPSFPLCTVPHNVEIANRRPVPGIAA